MKIAIPLYDRLTALDGIGPYEVLQRLPDATVTFVGTRTGEVRTENGFLGLVVDAHVRDLPDPDVIVVPGGIGTVLETMMIWQLLQVRHLKDTPLILVGRMWPGLVEWASTMMLSFDPPLANAPVFAIPKCVPTADEAIALIRENYSQWRADNPSS